MTWQRLLEPDIRDFIHRHEQDDVRKLALKGPPKQDWPWILILDQIKARQKARIKMPQWQNHHTDIIFPSSDIIEQASSAATARYKAHLVKGESFVDLTGGAGIDCYAFTENFLSGICVEQDKNAADLITHNIERICSRPVQVQHDRAENFVQQMRPVDLVYLDPQRRNRNKKGLYQLENCSPDINTLLSALAGKARQIMLKTSPMLDIRETIRRLEIVEAVHAIEWQGECKEVLFILRPGQNLEDTDIPITAAKIDDDGEILHDFTFTKAQEDRAQPHYTLPQKYLFEPGPAFQKAGGFNMLAKTYNINKLHKHTHLYTAQQTCADFPGRKFEIIGIFPVDKRALPVQNAHLTLRNFPGTAKNLRERLKLGDGGDDYLFACTLEDESRAMLHTRKIKKI